MKINVIYGTDNGNTRRVAEQIAERCAGRVVDICAATPQDFSDCDLLILGAPTSGYGDLQVDWECRLGVFSEVGLSGKKVALFGLGDQMSYCDTFVDAMGLLYDAVVAQGAVVLGATATSGYDFYSSAAVREERFVGLALDEDNQQDQTVPRIAGWVAELVQAAALPVEELVARAS
ncbi:MAG: flavodoxin FldA [Acidobacteriaceae bacterium]|nr:flavodoxin FldA [Acidobacteriaceae bacterium]